ncbi:MAG: SpvB/TcaC N-terminal domain-containing protein, partial [Myxococcota bacterium]
MNTIHIERTLAIFGATALCLFAPELARAQTGVDDDRVSLPAGPGSIDGVGDNVEIDPNMGAMSYSVGVEVPRGINGHTPSISLSYSSAAGSSELGLGWSMATRSIERMTSRRAPRYDADDLFAANGGSELVLVETNASTQVYRERFEGAFI